MPILRNISFRCKYSLTVQLLVLLFLISSIASACSSDPASEERADAPNERSREPEPDTASTRRSAAEPATLNLLGNPFVAKRSQSNSLSAYYDRISTDFTIDADPIENRHKPSVTDTIYTIRFGDSMVELYAPTQTGDLLLQVADIHSSDITLRNNLRVGMSQTELMNRLKSQGQDIKITQTPNEVVASNRDGAPISLHFHLKNGKVNRIRYEGYVD
ncbi:MAG: hypothetical protein LPK07_04610 [Hymenobacteraceae bacterium]|nr:hypothetical protein [Hymenobacteraceae bacterium]MDX5480942.1 hypothetical protein [Hymenobacteraceae bacterium]